jgi:predicted alpha-1,6-mannanase (GH76 family)
MWSGMGKGFTVRFRVCWLVVLCWSMGQAATASEVAATAPVSTQAAAAGVHRLQQWYNSETGLWNTTGWWNSANALTVLVNFSLATHSQEIEPVLERTYAQHRWKGFLNNFYDDEGWWALTWIDAWDLTRRPEYLATAQAIFDDMEGGWDGTCGGGIWWSKQRTYKNAIANELFLSVAAHLANRSSDAAQRAGDLEWAQREWGWFRHSGMIEQDHLISDGLGHDCRDNHARKWTYNQGVILGGLAELSRQPGQGGRLRQAAQIAQAAIHGLVDGDGILHDACEPRCSGDGTQFKGIFVRNLAELEERQPKAAYRKFIFRNAESILAHDQGPDHSLGEVWSGPVGKADASTQSCALDVLVAALTIEAREGNTR